MDTPLTSLMRRQNVSTKRRDRINSDEEERTRMGNDLVTAVRLERDPSRNTTRLATVRARVSVKWRQSCLTGRYLGPF